MDHPRNREVISTKGCIPDDVIDESSPLRELYISDVFKGFPCEIFWRKCPLFLCRQCVFDQSSLHKKGQELGGHFGNSSFAITLMIQDTESGGAFEYVADVRDADKDEMNFAQAGRVLDGQEPVQILNAAPGTFSLFRGRNSIHRVASMKAIAPKCLRCWPKVLSPALLCQKMPARPSTIAWIRS